MAKRIILARNVIMMGVLITLAVAVISQIIVQSYTSMTILIMVAIYSMAIGLIAIVTTNLLLRETVDISDAVNEEADNLFLYGGLGIIHYDESRNIEWSSDIFKSIGAFVNGKKIIEWQPKLAKLFENQDETTIIDIRGHKFEVYNDHSKRILYLKDITDFFTLENDFFDQQVCIIYLSIDNYEDVFNSLDERNATMLQSRLREMIVDWADANDVALKQYKEDTYFGFFNERIYNKMVSDKFKIIEDVNTLADDYDAVLSLSMGIGRQATAIRELDDMAINAINLARSRGGAQVAVKTKDEEVRYFGGNLAIGESSSRIKARVIAQALKGLIKQAKNIYIMGHMVSDFDSFGSSLAFYKICRAFSKNVHIIIDVNSLEEKVLPVYRDLIGDPYYSDVFISPSTALELNRNGTLLINVDNHKPSLAISKDVLQAVKNRVVIDHHRRSEEFVSAPVLTYLEPAASSTVELSVELMLYFKEEITLTEREATIMYTGLLIDTSFFNNRVTSRTFEIAATLKEMQADIKGAYDLLQDDYQTVKTKINIKSNSYLYKENILIAFADDNQFITRTILAQVGNDMMQISDIDAVFVVGLTDDNEVAVSSRSTSNINVQVICESLGGGGHFNMAAAQLATSDIEKVLGKLEKAIDNYLEERNLEK